MNINGVSISGKQLVITNGVVKVDGKAIDIELGQKPTLVINGNEGDLVSVITDLSIEINGNVSGDVNAGNSVHCNDVGGTVDAGNSVHANDINGNVGAGNSVTCKTIGGNVDAMKVTYR